MPRRVTLLAPAKINPWLAVGARRPDGYHEVDTCLCALELCDRLVIERTTTGRLELELSGPAATPDVPANRENLALRALERALALVRAREAVGERDGVALQLEKHVPSRAGLGGGSSDAAARGTCGRGRAASAQSRRRRACVRARPSSSPGGT